ncbi:hypothetical protein BpHYR1_007774 [Brachionus plicatilis]|uniref:Uncharacterized protein n=1 Tax=Brachionus plicatilis TaxID=10195 RepID=A0A3M7SYX5_BRAPC|nr:hypothetical protein BpHYR1_007774 [Brachionus plicatilis]
MKIKNYIYECWYFLKFSILKSQFLHFSYLFFLPYAFWDDFTKICQWLSKKVACIQQTRGLPANLKYSNSNKLGGFRAPSNT